jgi:hypothetical protein
VTVLEQQTTRSVVRGGQLSTSEPAKIHDSYTTPWGTIGWSEKVQDEYLETLWNMMSTFVDLAWGADSVQTVLETKRPSPSENLQPVAQRTSNPRNARNSLRKTGKRRI